MQGHARAHVRGHDVVLVAYPEPQVGRHRQQPVLLVVDQRARLVDRQKAAPLARGVGGDRLVAQVEGHVAGGGGAQHACEQQRGELEGQVREHVCVAAVMQEAGAGGQLRVRVAGVAGKGGRAAHDAARHRQAGRLQRCPQGLDRGGPLVAGGDALVAAPLVVVAVVAVQAGGLDPRQVGDEPVEGDRRAAAGCDAGAVHAQVHVEHDPDPHAGRGGGRGHRMQRAGVVHQRREPRAPVTPGQLRQPPGMRSEKLIRDQHLGGFHARQHLRFGDGRALEMTEPAPHQAARQVGRLLGLDVRPDPVGRSGDRDYSIGVAVEPVQVDQQRRAGQVTRIAESVVHGQPPAGDYESGRRSNTIPRMAWNSVRSRSHSGRARAARARMSRRYTRSSSGPV